MATITDFTSVSDLEWFESAESNPALPGSDTIELTNPVKPNLPHCFVGVQQFDAGGLPVLAGAGTYAIQIRTFNSEVWEDVPGSPIDATDPMTLNFASNISGIRAIPSAVTVTDTFRLLLTANGN